MGTRSARAPTCATSMSVEYPERPTITRAVPKRRLRWRDRGPRHRRRRGSSPVPPVTHGADPLAAPPPLPSLQRGPEPARIGNVLIGTASWTEKTLLASRTFYPPSVTTAEQRLRYYVRHFPVVEVDATYYALPSLENSRRWVERSEEHTSELQSLAYLVCRLLLEKKKKNT